jgi:hypothetical protein
VNFQVEVDSKTAHTFDFKVEYLENDVWVTHFFEWHPVVVSFNAGRNDAKKLEDYDSMLELFDDEMYLDEESLIYAEELAEKQYYDSRLKLLTNDTAHNFDGVVRLTCATAGNRTGGLKKNLEALNEFFKQAKPDFELTLAQLTLMYKGCLGEALYYEVESVKR